MLSLTKLAFRVSCKLMLLLSKSVTSWFRSFRRHSWWSQLVKTLYAAAMHRKSSSRIAQ